MSDFRFLKVALNNAEENLEFRVTCSGKMEANCCHFPYQG